MGYVLELGSAEDLAEVGGKARNLGILLRAGFPVPPGFCVTTAAYLRAVGSRLDEVFPDQAATEDDQSAQHGLAARARELVESSEVPAELAGEITAAYAGLGDGVPVAVRSSATAEDLEAASFAGQQDTYLNVVGAAAVLGAVRRCWASLWTDRAVSYRTSKGIDPASVSLAVVVQVMVDAVAAGVMFTADPVAGTRRRAVIDASPGLGEAVVSGAVNPDHLVVDSVTGPVVHRKLGDKRLAIRAVPGGGTSAEELPDGSEAGCLTDAQAAELARLGDGVERHYRAPQDTEWALDGDGRFWLTQARPITTLYPQLRRPDRDGTRLFFCISLAQGLTRPFTPMGLATIRMIGTSITRAALRDGPTDPLTGPTAFQEAGQRPFVDATAAFRNPMARRLMFGALGVMEARAAAVLRTLDDDPRFAVEPTGRLALIRGIARVMVRTRAPLHAAVAVASPARAVRRIDQAEVRLRRRLTAPATATPEERLDRIERALSVDTFMLMPSNVAYAAPGFIAQAVAGRLLGDRATSEELQTVLRGLPNNVTTDMDLALWELTEQVRADPPSVAAFRASVPELASSYAAGTLPPIAQIAMAGFLRQYGHRAVAEIDLGMPRWSDDPSHLLGVVKNYLALDDPALAPRAQFTAGKASAEAMTADLVRRAGGPGSLRGRVVGFALDRARRLTGLRESPKFLLIIMFGLIRADLQRVGAVLQRRGAINAADDIFFLDTAQARAGLGGNDLRPIVQANQNAYDAELKRRHIPRILLSDGTEPEATVRPADAPEGALRGSPASAGTVTAPARVILDPVGARLDPGEILVAPSTDPGWTPLFLTAGGLVMEMGGSNSHGAVVAREYGIPAVVGVPDATRRIRTGDQVTVDGAAGLVTPTAVTPDEPP